MNENIRTWLLLVAILPTAGATARMRLWHGMVMYDTLYAWCRQCQTETHNWPPSTQ